ncbi:transcription-repair coupling factor [Thiomicrorhabdus indica]|uniref:transcription-repair coupling factor n=1 Tax=Thiomicrorhabdus indica TaxID=2267253 RepID=UPI00102D6B7A|nr:transcription-repair coupling factor [Thiomicrorhabdus indica]
MATKKSESNASLHPLNAIQSWLSHWQPKGHRSHFGAMQTPQSALLISQLYQQKPGFFVVMTSNSQIANKLQDYIQSFLGSEKKNDLLSFPEWETLPYDRFSPHQDLVSERLKTLYKLPQQKRGILVLPVSTLMQKVVPSDYVIAHSFLLKAGEILEPNSFASRLEANSYSRVSQVMEHGEFAIRGSIIDVFPMGSTLPFRIDLFDDEVESIRSFDPESQRSIDKIEQIELLPAKEIDLTENGLATFRNQFRTVFGEDRLQSEVYQAITQGQAIGGIEYYLPLFHEKLATLFDYFPEDTLFFDFDQLDEQIDLGWQNYEERFEIGRHNIQYPILAPENLIQNKTDFLTRLKHYHRISLHPEAHQKSVTTLFESVPIPNLALNAKSEYPLAALNSFFDQFLSENNPKQLNKIILSTETKGRRESLAQLLKEQLPARNFEVTDSWSATLTLIKESPATQIILTITPLQESFVNQTFAVISESDIVGQTVLQKRRRRKKHSDFDSAVANLIELNIGSPIVHFDHGVGRYKGLETMELSGEPQEFMKIEYADSANLYVPVSSLHLISRYTGATPETAPLHKLGTDKWDKAKQKAAEKARDVAAELLDIYAQRAAQKGTAFQTPDDAYNQFSKSFPFEETPDQYIAIRSVVEDMRSEKPMDRLVCGDVGFGKTEVAMRAAFIAAFDEKQVAMLVPTTLLAHQHLENFRNRFADWPMRIEVLSRFQTAKEQKQIQEDLAAGKIDIIIGTHKLIQKGVNYQNLGLIIIDEEHRFGVRQKEQLKKMRAQVDVLTMTATPIPRTLNMAMNDLRDLSIIATPPAKRLAVQTFVQEWNPEVVREACLREIRRGGQVYLLYNHVDRIEKMAQDIQELIPESAVSYAHGQMNERQLESVMEDFYHRRFNILVCTTIIETGIDIPTANTILIHQADKFGLAQLHQLRGRVGRSHHRAYAYLFTAGKSQLTSDAEKRLTAIAKHDTLGAGFMLASHDLEIRGAGELLGDGQSGQITEIGFTLYSEILERAVKALKSGKQPELSLSLETGCEVDIGEPALIPETYLPDVHSRLVLYKRIAAAESEAELQELRIEIIDRFGLFPDYVQNLLELSKVKIWVNDLGFKKVDISDEMIRIQFGPQPKIDPGKLIPLIQSQPKQFDLKGQTELKFFDTMPTIDERMKAFKHLLQQITLEE